MAKIGLSNFRYGFLTEAADGTPTYSGAKSPGAAISCNVDINTNDAKLHANDVLQESDTSFAGGTITMGVDRYDYQTQADLLGHTYDAEAGKLMRSSDDLSPYVGIGRVVMEMVDGVYQFRGEFLAKCRLSEASQEDSTKSDSVEFNTFEMKGIVAQCANGYWSESQTFTTREAAIAYIEDLLGGATSV